MFKESMQAVGTIVFSIICIFVTMTVLTVLGCFAMMAIEILKSEV